MSVRASSVTLSEGSAHYFGWRILGASVIGMALSPGPLFWGSLGLFVAELQAEFGWDRAEIMLALTWVTIAAIPAMPIAGRLVDRYGARRVLLPSIVLLAVMLAVIPIVLTSIFTLYLLFFLAGFLTVGTQSIAYIRVLSSWFDRHRGLAIGITASGIGIGYAAIPPIVQWAIASYGWRGGYWVLAAIVIMISLPAMTVFVRNEPDVKSDENRANEVAVVQPGLSISDALRTRELWIIVVCILVVATVFNAMLPTMVPLLTDRGMSREDAVFALSMMGVAMAISRVVVGVLLDRIFAPLVAFVVFLVAASGLGLLASGVTGNAAVTAAFLIGLGFGAETDLMGYLVTRYFGLRAFGQIYGVILASFLVGTGVGPYLLSLAYQRQGNYDQALIIGAVLGLISAAAFLLLKKYPKLTTI